MDRNHPLIERNIRENHLAEEIGRNWKDLARTENFAFSEAIIETIQTENRDNIKECCIAVITRWMQREGQKATAGKLAEALLEIELTNVAEKLIGM